MRLAIMNGDPDSASNFSTYLTALVERCTILGHTVTRLDLAVLNLKGCTGCWSCWVRTPGECSKHDDSAVICRAAIESDLLLLASPIVMGFTTALLKRAADQMIPLIHPYFVIENGETHHRARYARYPKFGLLLATGPDTDAEDIDITANMWRRMARNMRSTLVFVAAADRDTREVADELALVA